MKNDKGKWQVTAAKQPRQAKWRFKHVSIMLQTNSSWNHTDWWQVTGDLWKITEAQARCFHLAKVHSKSHDKKKAGHVKKEIWKTSDCSQCPANWTVQQLAPDPNPKLHKTQHLIGTIGSDYLFAKIWLLVCKVTQNESKFDVAVVIWLPRLPRPQRIPWACWRLGSCQWKKYKTAKWKKHIIAKLCSSDWPVTAWNHLKIKQWSRKQIASLEQSLFAPVFTGS